MVLIFPPEPSKECVKVSHVIIECRVINHHPLSIVRWTRNLHKPLKLVETTMFSGKNQHPTSLEA